MPTLMPTWIVVLLIGLYGETEALQCYICGPKSEQVHRNLRPPMCELATQPLIRTCDAEFNHCAIVAHGPPYTESRICSKLTQRTCERKFCNTTKSWSVTCSCKGDLCNQDKDKDVEREFQDLETLMKQNLTIRSEGMVEDGPVMEE